MAQRIGLAIALVAVLAASAAAADIRVPDTAGLYNSTLLAADAGGHLYCFDGDVIYKLNGTSFAPILSDLTTTAGAVVDPSAFTVNAAGTLAYFATGMSGHVVEANLANGTSRELSGVRESILDIWGNYGLAVDPVTGKLFMTNCGPVNRGLYLVDPTGDGLLTKLKDFYTLAVTGSGLTFTPDGKLIAPIVKTYANYPTDDNFPADIYAFSHSFVDGAATGVVPPDTSQIIASNITVTGTGGVAADKHGNVYLVALDGIYKVDPSGAVSVVEGDPSLINVFDPDVSGTGYMGLAYDQVTDQVFYAYRATTDDNWLLGSFNAAPEPATLALLAGGAALAWLRRRKR